MLKELNFSHFGLAVNDLNDAESFFINFGYKISKSEFDYNQNIQASLLEHPINPTIEVISKAKSSDKTPIDNILRNNDNSIYHICFECKNIKKFTKAVSESNTGLRQITKSTYSPLFKKKITFYITTKIGIIEIIHN